MANPFMNFIDTLDDFSREMTRISEEVEMERAVLRELRLDQGKVESCKLLHHLREARIDRSALKVITKNDLEQFFSKYPIPLELQAVFISRVQEWQKNNNNPPESYSL